MNNAQVHVIEAKFYPNTLRRVVERAQNYVVTAAGYEKDSLRIKSYDEASGEAVFEVHDGVPGRHRQLLREVHKVTTIEPEPGEKLTVYFAPGTSREQVEQARDDVERDEGCFSPDMVVLNQYDEETRRATFDIRAGFSESFRTLFIEDANVISVESQD